MPPAGVQSPAALRAGARAGCVWRNRERLQSRKNFPLKQQRQAPGESIK